jgi:hypothetical protein
MKIQDHPRFQNIHRVSGYFLFLTGFLIILTPLIGLGMCVKVLFTSSGDIGIVWFLSRSFFQSDFLSAFDAGVTLPLKIFVLAVITLTIVMAEIILIHLNKLLSSFWDGDVFNVETLKNAKTAFKANIFISVFYLGLELVGWLLNCITTHGMPGEAFAHLIDSVVDNAVWFGITLLIIWALEIGVALHEESELTI